MAWKTQDQCREWLIGLFTEILGDKEAGVWVVDRKTEKIRDLQEKYSNKKVALVSFDVDRIKDFVFGTSKPLEIQGASAMVKQMEMDAEDSILKDVLKQIGLNENNVLFSGGGTGLLIVPANNAKELSERISSSFSDKTANGSCSVVYQILAPDELLQGPGASVSIDPPPQVAKIEKGHGNGVDFGQIVQLLADKQREVKGEKLYFVNTPLPGFIARCESCGKEAALKFDQIRPVEKKDRICTYCFSKRQRGRDERDKQNNAALKTAQTIDDIGGEGGYYAIVYADADNMGSTLLKLQSMADYAIFSRSVTQVLRELSNDLITGHKLGNLYQMPVLGGDDLVLLVPASKVACITLDIVRKVPKFFEKITETLKTNDLVRDSLKNINFSVGFVIVPSNFDIRYALDYAESLLRSAKRGRKEKKTNKTCIDYHVIKDGSPLNFEIKELRNEQIRKLPNHWEMHMSLKPITSDELEHLIKSIDLIYQAKLSKNQLRQILNYLQVESPKVASLLSRCQMVRIKAWGQLAKLMNIDNVQGLIDQLNILRIKETGPNDCETGFFDLMELYEFWEK